MGQKELLFQVLTEAVEQGFGSVYHWPRLIPVMENQEGLEGILSSIYLKGDIVGKLSFFVQQRMAARVVAGLLSLDEVESGSSEVIDGVDEILNLVAGRLKKNLEPHQLNFSVSVPSTRLTRVIPVSTWGNNIEQFFAAEDVVFKVLFSYRLPSVEERETVREVPAAKSKLSAAELLRQAMSRKE